ncbi:hypothetical protein V5085_11080 [Moellerella wisconsensis]|uniref:hypothetical protein n=1 Tax=Moellerella wisconsensis TaxID=158849 RepID=UPI00307602DD
MNIGDEVVACVGIRRYEGSKCIAIYGVGEFLGELMPEPHHPLTAKERVQNTRLPQNMANIGSVVVSEWQSPFYTVDEFNLIVAKNVELEVIKFPIIVKALI